MPIVSRQQADGSYVHRCAKCGVGRVNKYPRYAFTCDCTADVQRAPFTPPSPVLRQAVPKSRTSSDNFDCAHLLDGEGPVYGFNATQINCGCQGSKLTAVFECELYKLCAPFARSHVEEEPAVMPCKFCPSYRRIQRDAPTSGTTTVSGATLPSHSLFIPLSIRPRKQQHD